MNRTEEFLAHYGIDSGDFIAHHGIKGQKWGIRRFQNEDGSLTPDGRIRYGIGNADKERIQKKIVDICDEANAEAHSYFAGLDYKSVQRLKFTAMKKAGEKIRDLLRSEKIITEQDEIDAGEVRKAVSAAVAKEFAEIHRHKGRLSQKAYDKIMRESNESQKAARLKMKGRDLNGRLRMLFENSNIDDEYYEYAKSAYHFALTGAVDEYIKRYS